MIKLLLFIIILIPNIIFIFINDNNYNINNNINNNSYNIGKNNINNICNIYNYSINIIYNINIIILLTLLTIININS